MSEIEDFFKVIWIYPAQSILQFMYIFVLNKENPKLRTVLHSSFKALTPLLLPTTYWVFLTLLPQSHYETHHLQAETIF